jgi:hypothetical protein
MFTEIPPIFLRRLIAIGETQNFSELQQLFVEYPPESMGHFMRQMREFWYPVADSLSDSELEALIRALTIAERDFRSFGGGSVSGVIWTFRRLEQRMPCMLDTLANWILAHTSNPYLPFGTDNGGARSLVELDEYHKRVSEERKQRQKAEEDRHTAAAARKAQKATHDIFSAIRRKDTKAVHALLMRGARVDLADATGTTAMAYAQALGHTPILELIQSSLTGI